MGNVDIYECDDVYVCDNVRNPQVLYLHWPGINESQLSNGLFDKAHNNTKK